MPEFPVVRYVNKYTKGTMMLPSEDFKDGKCTLVAKDLLSQFRSEPDDAKAAKLKERCMKEAERLEGLAKDEDLGMETREKYAMRWMYSLSCIAQMNI